MKGLCDALGAGFVAPVKAAGVASAIALGASRTASVAVSAVVSREAGIDWGSGPGAAGGGVVARGWLIERETRWGHRKGEE